MDITPRISTPPVGAKRVAYEFYLRSPEWRKRRDTALRLAGFRCQRCQSKRELQVHHKTYERLGEELDDDLEALCRSCHEGHHHDEGYQQNLTVYIKLVSEVLKAGRPDSVADLADVVKSHCARLKLPYNTGQVERAITLLDERIPFTDPKFHRAWQPPPALDSPITQAEAERICRKLEIKVPFRSIPKAIRTTQRQVDRVKAAQMVAAEILEAVQRCEELENALIPSKAVIS